MLDKERIILLAEEKLYSLLDKDYSDWNEDDRSLARDKFDRFYSYTESED
jgi:hypothetical protein